MTRQVSVKRSMKKKVRGCGGGSCQRDGDVGSLGGEKEVEEVSLGRELGVDVVQRCLMSKERAVWNRISIH